MVIESLRHANFGIRLLLTTAYVRRFFCQLTRLMMREGGKQESAIDVCSSYFVEASTDLEAVQFCESLCTVINGA